MYVCMYVCMYIVYITTHIHTYVYVYTHTHTHTCPVRTIHTYMCPRYETDPPQRHKMRFQVWKRSFLEKQWFFIPLWVYFIPFWVWKKSLFFPDGSTPTLPTVPPPRPPATSRTHDNWMVARQTSCRQQTAPPQPRCSKDVTTHPHRPGARPGRPCRSPPAAGSSCPAGADSAPHSERNFPIDKSNLLLNLVKSLNGNIPAYIV